MNTKAQDVSTFSGNFVTFGDFDIDFWFELATFFVSTVDWRRLERENPQKKTSQCPKIRRWVGKIKAKNLWFMPVAGSKFDAFFGTIKELYAKI